MVQIEIIGKAVAVSIHGSRKFAADEHKLALTMIAKESKPEDLVDNMAYIGNVSAIRQQLEKAGLVTQAAQELNAFQRQVASSIAKLDGATKGAK